GPSVDEWRESVQSPALVPDTEAPCPPNRTYFLAKDCGATMQGECKLDAGKSVPEEPCGLRATPRRCRERARAFRPCPRALRHGPERPPEPSQCRDHRRRSTGNRAVVA